MQVQVSAAVKSMPNINITITITSVQPIHTTTEGDINRDIPCNEPKRNAGIFKRNEQTRYIVLVSGSIIYTKRATIIFLVRKRLICTRCNNNNNGNTQSGYKL